MDLQYNKLYHNSAGECMNGFGNWLRNLGAKLAYGLRRFMTGRYGTDKLNMAILGVGLAACLISMFIHYMPVNLALTGICLTI